MVSEKVRLFKREPHPCADDRAQIFATVVRAQETLGRDSSSGPGWGQARLSAGRRSAAWMRRNQQLRRRRRRRKLAAAV